MLPGDADGHVLMTTGSIIWCSLCGRYSEVRTHRLKDHCEKEPKYGAYYRLKRLREGRHPTIGRTIDGKAQ